MDHQMLPYQNLGEGALDIFGSLLAWVFLGGILIVLLMICTWILIKVLIQSGIYKPTGPIDQRMGRLLGLCILVVVMGGSLALMMYLFTVDFRPELPAR